MAISICKSFSCPYWSDGTRTNEGITGGYGCTKFSTAMACPVSQVKGVSETQYELFAEEGGSQNRDTMIALGIAHLVFREIEVSDERKARANQVKWSKAKD
jgi:hypothetical protein